MTLAIRSYRDGDADALIALFRASVRTVAVDYSEAQRRAWAPDRIDRDAFAARRAAKPCWVATADDAIVGFTDLDAGGHIDMFYVSADHQRRGVARLMLAHVEEQAAGRGLERLSVDASETARGFFERSGFAVTARQDVPRAGEMLWNYRMEKRLSR